MNRTTLQMRDFAKRLTAYEMLQNKSSEDKPGVFEVSDRMRPTLAKLMGIGGFQTLLSRALALATAEVSWLKAVHVSSEGLLVGIEEVRTQLDPEDFQGGGVVMIAQLLGLLVAFIGEVLTLRLVRDVWPKIPLNNLDFDN